MSWQIADAGLIPQQNERESKMSGQLQRKPAGPSGATCARQPPEARLAIEIDRATLDGLVMMAAELRAEGFRDATPARLAADMVASVVEDDQAAHAECYPARH